MKFNENLKTFRLSQDLGQKQLAEKLGISIKTVSHWETGYTEPDISQLIKIADFFKISIDELVGRE